jgi:hypothetical protein
MKTWRAVSASQQRRISAGMSRAFKARSRACPTCGKKTIQPKQRHYWKTSGHVCRWCDHGKEKANGCT